MGAAGEVSAILDRARELGVNLIDTAAGYGNHRAEALIGEAVAGTRPEWAIATKFGNRFDVATGDVISDFSLPAVKSQLDQSLTALRTDYIDLYQFHSGTNEDFANDALWEWLGKQVRTGTIRALGLSIANDLVEKGDLNQVELAGERGVSVVQVVYNRLVRKAEAGVIPLCATRGMGVLARVPLARGILTGKFRPGHSFPAGDYRSRFGETKTGRLLAEAERIRAEEIPPDVVMSQWALAWCLQNSSVSAVIPGCRRLRQLESNAAAAGLVRPCEADDRTEWKC